MTTKELKEYISSTLGNNVKCLLSSYWWKRLFGLVLDRVDAVSTSTTNSIKGLSSKIDNLSNKIQDVEFFEDITYSELVKLRNARKLIPGKSYRITDYECTINDDDPTLVVLPGDERKSHKFCIVVTALTENQLSENAKATMSSNSFTEGFDEKAAWELKYTLSNDVNNYSWARKGFKSYDAVAVFKPTGYSRSMSGCFYWDDDSQKYLNDDLPDSWLVKSMTDKSPLSQTTFNYGDVIYVSYFSEIIETTVSYVNSMKDTGEGVLVNMYPNTMYPSYSYPFVWNDSLGTYICKLWDDFDYKLDMSKRDHFVRNAYCNIYKIINKYTSNCTVVNGEFFVSINGECLEMHWDSSENKYIGMVFDTPFILCNSLTDNTPISQTNFNLNDEVYITSSPENIFSGTICYINTGSISTDRFMLEIPGQGGLCVCMQWDPINNLYGVVIDSNNINSSLYLVDDITKLPISKLTSISEGDLMTYCSGYTNSHVGLGISCGFYIPEGKGVIYYLKDHNNNEAYYDFKNILFQYPDCNEPKFTFHGTITYNGVPNTYVDYSEWSSVNNKIEKSKSGDINKVSLNHSSSTVVSGKVFNVNFAQNTSYKYIGLDSSENISIVDIYDGNNEINEIRQIIIDNEEVTAAALNDLNSRIQDGAASFDSDKEDLISKALNDLNSRIGVNDDVVTLYFDPTSKTCIGSEQLTQGKECKLNIKGTLYYRGLNISSLLTTINTAQDLVANLLAGTFSNSFRISIPVLEKYCNAHMKVILEIRLYDCFFDAIIHETITNYGDVLQVSYTKLDACKSKDSIIDSKMWEIPSLNNSNN